MGGKGKRSRKRRPAERRAAEPAAGAAPAVRETAAAEDSTPAAPAPSRASPLLLAGGAALIVGLTLLVYWPGLNGPFLWDDHHYVADNTMLHSPGGIRELWLEPASYTMQYFPVTYSSFWLEWQLWGERTTGYHVVNVLLHAANALLFWLLLARLAVPGAYTASLLFALHPVHVESVTWICERKNTLSLFFLLLAFLAWERFRSDRRPASHALLLLAYVFGLLSKSIVALLPALLALRLWWRSETPRLRRDLLGLLPLVVLGALMLGVTAWVESRHMSSGHGLTPAISFLAAGRALWFHAGKLLLPLHLMPIYPKWAIDPTRAAQWLPPLAWLALLAILYRRRDRFGRGPFFAAAAFTLAHLPTAGVFDFGFLGHSWVADHFQYLPSLPFLALLAAVVACALRRWSPRPRTFGIVLTALAAALLGGLTWRQNGHWSSREAFWRHAWEGNPTLTAAGALGDEYLRRDELEKALPWLERSLLIQDNERGHFRLGELLTKQGRLDEALAAFRRAIEVNARRNQLPALEARAWFNMGAIHWRRREWNEAADCFRSALRAQPEVASFAEWLEKAEARLEP